MNLTITDDMTIKYVTGGMEYTLDRMIFSQNGSDHVVYERSSGGTDYTEVSCLKMTSPKTYGGVLPTAYDHIYFDTGIKVNKDLKWRCKFAMFGTNGGTMLGDITYTTDDKDYRVFNYMNMLDWDVGYPRRLASYSMSGKYGTMIDFTFGNFYYTNNDTSQTYTGTTSTYTQNNANFMISMNTIKFHELWIWDTDGTTLLFHGLSVLDSSNVPCVYDYVSDTLIYATYQNNTTACGTLTYEA